MNAAKIEDRLFNRETPSLEPLTIYDSNLTAPINQSGASELIKAGLHLLNDNLKGCHDIAQSNYTAEGSYLHAIMHRREGDYSNSKYWVRKVGKHSVWNEIENQFPDWGPLLFVDWCESAKKGGFTKPLDWLKNTQAIEIRLLLQYMQKNEI